MAASVRTFQTVGKEHTTVRRSRTPGRLSRRSTIAWGMLSRPKGVERKTMAAKPELEAFSDALKRAREDSGMSLRALAEAVEASHTVVAQWERGEHAPRPPRVRMLEHVLQLPPGSLSRLLGYWPAETTDAPPVGVIEAARADPQLGERDRRILTAVYRELVRKQAKDGNT
jgi:transcriptional regulator with XRE-family HTH domain